MARERVCPCAWDCWSPRCWVFLRREDTSHATRISSPLCKGGNRRPGAREGLPLCMGTAVAMLLGLPLVAAERIGYRSTTDAHPEPEGVRQG